FCEPQTPVGPGHDLLRLTIRRRDRVFADTARSRDLGDLVGTIFGEPEIAVDSHSAGDAMRVVARAGKRQLILGDAAARGAFAGIACGCGLFGEPQISVRSGDNVPRSSGDAILSEGAAGSYLGDLGTAVLGEPDVIVRADREPPRLGVERGDT